MQHWQDSEVRVLLGFRRVCDVEDDSLGEKQKNKLLDLQLEKSKFPSSDPTVYTVNY